MDTLRVVGNAIGRMSAKPGERMAASRSRSDAVVGPLAVLGAAALANLLLQGFEFPRYNNIFHVAIVLDYFGSAEGPHDLFHQTLGAFVSVLWPLLARVATEDNIFSLFFAVYALNRAPLLLFLYLAAAEISPRPGYAVAAAVGVAVLMLWPAWSLSPLAYNDTFVRSLSQTELGVTALVACLWLMLRRQWVWAAVVLGAIFNVSAFLAVWGMTIAAAVYLWTNRTAPWLPVARHLLLLGLTAAALAAPTALWVANVAVPPPALELDYRAYLEEFFPYHNLVHTNWTGALVTAALAAIVWDYVRDARLYASTHHRETITAAFLSALLILLVGAVQPYLINSRLLGCLFPLRMDTFLLVPLFVVLIAAALASTVSAATDRQFWLEALMLLSVANGNMPLALYASTLRDPDTRPRHGPAIVLLLASAVDVLTTGEIPVLYRATGLAALGLGLTQAAAAALAVRDEPRRDRTLLLVAALILPALIGGTPGALAPYAIAAAYAVAAGWIVDDRIPALPLLGAAASVAALGLAMGGGGMARGVVLVAAAVVLVRLVRRSAVFPAIEGARRWVGLLVIGAGLVAGAARVTLAGTINYLPAEDRAFGDAAHWLRANSRPDELVLPINIWEFSTLSRRPVWVDLKMGAAVMWQPSYYPVWHQRLIEVRRLNTLDAILSYARMNAIAYVVVRQSDLDGLAGPAGEAAPIYSNPYAAIFSATGAPTVAGDSPER